MEEKKLLSPTQIAGGSLWGGPIATVYYLRRNYLSLGKDDYAQKTLLYGTIFIIFFMCFLPFIPEEFPNVVLPLIYCLSAQKIAATTQLEKEKIEQSEEYTFESNWKIFGVGILTLVLLFVMAVIVILGFEAAGFVSLA